MIIIKRIAFFSFLLLLIIITGFFIGDYFSKSYMKNMEASHQHFHEKLKFTPKQLDKLIPIEEKYSKQKTLYEGRARQATIELADILRKEKAYTPEVQAAVEKVHIAMGHILEVTLIHFFDMREILDEEQAQILDDYVTEELHGL